MKKTIQQLLNQLGTDHEGKLTGGFTSIKGGYSALVVSQNQTCDNGKGSTCSGTNTSNCTNSGDCTKSTNNAGTCTNTTNCFM